MLNTIENYTFQKEIIPSRKTSYHSLEPLEEENAGALPLLKYLIRTADSNAPYFNTGNLLFHSIASENGRHDRQYQNFQVCKPSAPGLHQISLFPVTNVQCMAFDCLAIEGAKVRFFDGRKEKRAQWEKNGRIWTPVFVEDHFVCDDAVQLKQRSAILPCTNADVLICELELSRIPEAWSMEVSGKFFRPCRFSLDSENVLWGVVCREVPDFRFTDGPWKGTEAPSTAVGTPFAVFCDQEFLEGTPAGESSQYVIRYKVQEKKIRILFAAGLEQKDVAKALKFVQDNLEECFRLAERPLKNYFAAKVPSFSCSDRETERVYAELSVTGFLSTYDVGYEPYHYPFTCPAGKTIPSWRMQFYHDSTFSARSFLWLNDPQLCKNDLLQMCTEQYVHVSPRLGRKIPEQILCMPLVFNMLPQEALEIYHRTGDRVFLRKVYEEFLLFDREKLRPKHSSRFHADYREIPPQTWLFPLHHFDSDGDWLLESQLSGDDTCRGDEFQHGQQAKNWWDHPDPPLEPADINFYVLGNRKALLRMAEIFGEEDVCNELRNVIAHHAEAIEQNLWDAESELYTDITEQTHQRSHVPDAQNITVPLYTKSVSRDRAALLKEKIFDPALFGTPLSLPSCPVCYTGIGGKQGFRPTGYWRGLTWGVMHYEAIFGLFRYGFRKEASFLLHRFWEALKRAHLPSPENFNPLTGEAVGAPFMGFSSQMIHPFLSLVTGLQIREGNDLVFDPVALDPEWEEFSFGPYLYRPETAVTVLWRKNAGYSVRVNLQEFHFRKPSHFSLREVAGKYQLDPDSVKEIDFKGKPPFRHRLFRNGETLVLEIQNLQPEEQLLNVRNIILELDHGIRTISTESVTLSPEETRNIRIHCGHAPDKWLLSSVESSNYFLPVVEGFDLKE